MTTHANTDETVPDDELPLGAQVGGAPDSGGLGDRNLPASGSDDRGDGNGATMADGDEAALSFSLGVRLIGRFVRMHPGPFALSLAGGVGWAVMLVASSIVLGRVTDEVIEPAFRTGVEASTVWTAVAVLVGVGLLRGLSVVVRRWFGSVTEARMQRSLRSAVAERLLDMPMDSYRNRPTGQLLATSDVDVTTSTQMLMPLPFSLGVVALVVVALASLWSADPGFALVALVLFPALAWLSKTYTTWIHEPSARVQQKLGVVSSIAHESFDGVMVVKTLGREAAERERFDAAAGDLAQERIGLARLATVFEPVFTMLPNVGMVTLLLVGAARIEQGAATAGDLVQAIALFGWLAFPMRVVGFLFQAMPRAVVSIARVDDLLAEPSDPAYAAGAEGRMAEARSPGVAESPGPEASAGPAELPGGALSLALDGVGFSFAGNEVLRDVTFEAGPGEVLALVGSTGSGKSTLVNLLAHLDTPHAGRILLGGVDTADLDHDDLRSELSVAFQESYLFARSVEENITLGREVADASVRESLGRAMAAGFVGELPDGIGTVVGERGVTLSGGQRQRVALARALAGRPRVVVLDDATSAVDPVVESQILDSLRHGDTTMLVVAHRLSTILLADRVVHLDGGRVRGVGTHEELLADPDYVALVTAYEEEEATAGVVPAAAGGRQGTARGEGR